MARAALAGLLVCVLALAGCAALADLGQLREDLDSAGYDAANINHNTTNGFTVLSVGVSMPDAVPTDEDAEKVAEVVWTKYPADFDQLKISMNGEVRLDASADELTRRFGERPESLDVVHEGNESNGMVVIVAVAVAALLAGLMVWLWHRGRRPPPPVAPPPGYHQPGGYYQYPPQPPQG
ncbi:MAG: hypothetical protein WBA97_01100 [Actinophytocola sp.]|uniref:hypothetical protein n=1 Tax=Actinophytocola sp. TaxID=1872138 RepID=UPI003C77ED6A